MKDCQSVIRDLQAVQSIRPVPDYHLFYEKGVMHYAATLNQWDLIRRTAEEAEQAITALLRDRESLLDQLTEEI